MPAAMLGCGRVRHTEVPGYRAGYRAGWGKATVRIFVSKGSATLGLYKSRV
jgi:hypothetical protein